MADAHLIVSGQCYRADAVRLHACGAARRHRHAPSGLARLMRRGEIRWYRFQQPDKKRPVLILTRDSALEFRKDVTIAPITTVDIPSEVALDTADGVPRPCVVNLDHIQTVTKTRLGSVIATLPADRMKDVEAALLFALGVDS